MISDYKFGNFNVFGYEYYVETQKIQQIIENNQQYEVYHNTLIICDDAEMPTMIKFKEWKLNGVRHREKGPAISFYIDDQGEWWIDNQYITHKKEIFDKYLRKNKLEKLKIEKL